ncbi:MAG TPA: hypothetical protein VKB75_01270 [Jatrophihabitans sp.]|nr:hypothetical protein [Jatrophihabitans sp.]
MPFTVLVVCTGNISRSPMTQLLLEFWSDPKAGLVVSSAGTHALVGQPMDDGAASAMRELGIDPSRHRARQFQPDMAAEADLIITAEQTHLEVVLAQTPTALRRAFTIKEFARLVAHVDAADPDSVVAQAAALRGLVPRPADAADDDVADPHRQPTAVSRSTAAELTVAVRAIVDALGVAAKPAGTRRRPLPYRR